MFTVRDQRLSLGCQPAGMGRDRVSSYLQLPVFVLHSLSDLPYTYPSIHCPKSHGLGRFDLQASYRPSDFVIAKAAYVHQHQFFMQCQPFIMTD
jgi:hypothetical protein